MSHCLAVCFGGGSITGPRGYQASKAQASAFIIMPGAFPVEFKPLQGRFMRYTKGGARNRASFWKCLTGGEACRNGDFRECPRTPLFQWLSSFYGKLGRVGGEGNGNPLQCSCLENPRDGGAWWAALSGVAQSRTQLKRLSSIPNVKLS